MTGRKKKKHLNGELESYRGSVMENEGRSVVLLKQETKVHLQMKKQNFTIKKKR